MALVWKMICNLGDPMSRRHPVAVPHRSTGWRRPIECPIFTGHFPQKSLIISGSFAKNDVQPQASHGSLPLSTAILRSEFSKCSSELIFEIVLTFQNFYQLSKLNSELTPSKWSSELIFEIVNILKIYVFHHFIQADNDVIESIK